MIPSRPDHHDHLTLNQCSCQPNPLQQQQPDSHKRDAQCGNKSQPLPSFMPCGFTCPTPSSSQTLLLGLQCSRSTSPPTSTSTPHLHHISNTLYFTNIPTAECRIKAPTPIPTPHNGFNQLQTPTPKTLRVTHATELHFGRELAQCDRRVTGVATLRSWSGSRPRHSSEARIPRARPSQWGLRRRGVSLGERSEGRENEERYGRLRSDRK